MSYSVDSLEPKLVWKYFDKIRQIPHGSGNEKALGEAILGWVRDAGHEAEMDARGNVVARISGTPGLENAPTVVLQGHIDMVCEKNNDVDFDFEKDAVRLKRDGDWIAADGTTLGADNGIGAAVALTFIEDKDTPHGPLELLFTVEEETGLHGARALAPGFVKGRMLFNLDSEEDGVFYVGCAGGRDSNLTLPFNTVPTPSDKDCYKITVKGLRGGHSGLDIVQNRGNAIKLVARTLARIGKEHPINLVSIDGGDKHNAIPREAGAVVFAQKGQAASIQEMADSLLQGFKDEFAAAEPGLELTVIAVEPAKQAMDIESTKKTLDMLLGLPHGVLAVVRDMKGMVETSTNLARVRTEANTVAILKSSRSSVSSALDGVVAQIEAVGRAVGAEVKVNEGYPGWQPNFDSKMLATAKAVWKETFQSDADFQVIHAGLECGIIGEKYPGMDMISLGPTILNPHSPDEKTSISSVDKFDRFVKAFLPVLAKA